VQPGKVEVLQANFEISNSCKASPQSLTLELSGGEAVRLERVVRCHSALRYAVEPKVVKRLSFWIVFEFEETGASVQNLQEPFGSIRVTSATEGVDEDEFAACIATTLKLKRVA
jgi:hypothetical protein